MRTNVDLIIKNKISMTSGLYLANILTVDVFNRHGYNQKALRNLYHDGYPTASNLLD